MGMHAEGLVFVGWLGQVECGVGAGTFGLVFSMAEVWLGAPYNCFRFEYPVK